MIQMSRTMKRGIATKKAKASARWNIALHASRDGLSKAEAARLAQMTENGINSLLFRMVGSTAWPIKE